MIARRQQSPRVGSEQCSQLTLFKESPWEQFHTWKAKPGAGHVIRDLYALAAPYAAEYLRTGIQVSMKLLFEIERHRMKRVKARAQGLGIRMPSWEGYTLNNSLTAPIARHIEEHRPDWKGMFERRESPGKHNRQFAIVITR